MVKFAHRMLAWLFEEDTLTPAVAVLIYVLVWFLPVIQPGVNNSTDATVWKTLGWGPNGFWAVIITIFSIYQVVCCRVMRCIWWTRIATSLFVSSFVIYTAVWPAYIVWHTTETFPEYFAGSAVVIFACVLLVARNLRRESDGVRAA